MILQRVREPFRRDRHHDYDQKASGNAAILRFIHTKRFLVKTLRG